MTNIKAGIKTCLVPKIGYKNGYRKGIQHLAVVNTYQNWEQGRRNPVGPARALLKIASENPEAVKEALEI